MFGLVVRFDLRDDAAAAAFDALVADLLPRIAAEEPGTLAYEVHTVVDAPLSRIFYERYADRAAFAQHEAGEHTRRFLAAREPLVARLRVEFLGS